MNASIGLILLVLALVFMILEALSVPAGRIKFWALSAACLIAFFMFR